MILVAVGPTYYYSKPEPNQAEPGPAHHTLSTWEGETHF